MKRYDDPGRLGKEFERLCQIEPRLRELAVCVRAHAKRTEQLGYEITEGQFWYEQIKPPLSGLVGWYAAKPAIRSSVDWDTAYKYLYGLLPAARTRPTPAARRFAARGGGLYVHFLKDGRIDRQAMIVNTRKRGMEVQLLYFEWLTGGPNNTVWCRTQELQECRFYADAGAWRAAADSEQAA